MCQHVIRMGQEFKLQLPENPSTGYRWELTLPSGISLVADNFIGNGDKAIGAGGVREFTLRADKAGKYQLHAEYSRWGQEVADTRDINLNIAQPCPRANGGGCCQHRKPQP